MDDLDLIGNPIWKHHQNNIDEGTYVRNEDGSVSTVYTTIMGDGEYEYLIPQVWDGKILEPEEAFQRAMDSGVDWPREPAGVEGVKRLERLDELLHENMVGFDKGGLVDEDRQTQEAFEDYSAVSSIPEESIDRTPLSAEQRRDLLRDSAKFVAEMTPIVGDAMSAREVWEELQKEEPNYLLVGALAGATAVGLIPGIGDAAAQAIRTGARRGLDFARRVEVDPNALGSTGGNIRLRPEDQPTPEVFSNVTTPTPLSSLEELTEYNNRVRTPQGLLDRDRINPNDNILYRPDRFYRFIGEGGYQDFLDSGMIRPRQGTKQGYEIPYFMSGKSSSRYGQGESGRYLVEAVPEGSWRSAGGTAETAYKGPENPLTTDRPIRVFRRNDDGTFEVVFDNIGDTALLPSQFNRGGLVDEDRQTQEAFDATTGQAMALTPPRVEDQALVPRSEAGQGVEPLEFARPSFESAVERFRSAGAVDVDPDDPALFNAYRRSMDYLGDMALGGLDLTDAAFKAAVGIVAQALPEDQERRFARDMVSMPEAFMGYSPGRIQAATDRVAEGVAQVGRNLQQPGPMPTLGSNLGNLAARAEEPTRTSGRVTNPLISPRRSVMSEGDLDGSTLLTFYSALRSAVEQMTIAKEGSTGQTIMAYLKKRAPNVSSHEISFSNLNLDPQKRYTREEVLSAIERDTSTIEANYLTGASTQYKKDQRQNVTDPEVEYFEVLLDDTAEDAFATELNHFSDRTYAYSRSSVRSNPEYGDYILIEELQSDPLQQGLGARQPVGYEEPDFFVEAALDELFEPKDATPSRSVLSFAFNDLFNPNNGRTREEIKAWYKDNFNVEVSGRDRRALHIDAIRKTTTDYYENEDFFDSQISEMFDEIVEEGSNYRSNLLQEEVLPFNTNTQYVRNLLISNIAKAKSEGIDRIVIPPLEELVRPRGTMEDLGPAFRQTYQNAVRKAVNILNNETQGQIQIGSQKLQYPEASGNTRTVHGTLLDISNFDFNPQTQAVRFAEGGVVSMEEQMSLFDMGGLTDDGAMRDPVSGNEIPPGSMASEVRDDVPAMLSEGEYIVPADVVRYYGVKFFEDLRGQAKSGMMDMEQNGRIGGEPVGAPEDDLTPEELQMLAEITGMAVGGDVRRPTEKMMSVGEALANMSIYEAINSPGIIWTPSGHQATTPEMKRELFRSMGLIQIAEESGDQTTRAFQEGGVVGQPFTPIPNYNIPGFSLFQPTQTAAPTPTPVVPQTESVTLYGPNGEVITLTLPTDQERYNQLLAQGYTTQPRAPTQLAQAQDSSNDREDDFVFSDDDTTSGFLKPDMFDALNSDPLAFGQSMLEKKDFTRIAGGLGSFALGPFGSLAAGAISAGITANNVAQARAAVEIAKSRGLDTTQLEANINKYVEGLPNAARLMAENVTGERIVNRFNNQLEQDTGTAPPAPQPPSVTTQPSPAPTQTEAERQRQAAAQAEANRQYQASMQAAAAEAERQRQAAAQAEANRQYQASMQAAQNNDNDDRPTSWTGGSVAQNQSKPAAQSPSESRASAQRAADRAGVSMATRGRAKGGLVAKPDRKKPVA